MIIDVHYISNISINQFIMHYLFFNFDNNKMHDLDSVNYF